MQIAAHDSNISMWTVIHLKTLVQIAHGIDTKVIAEHIETQQELDTAMHLLVDGFQGYLVAKPGPLTN